MGCAYYQNSRELAKQFLTDEPFNDLQTTIVKNALQSVAQAKNEQPALFYLKSQVNTDASIRLTERLQNSSLSLVIDDPGETLKYPLKWYVQAAYQAHSAVVHLAAEQNELDSSFFHNIKCSLVSGIIYGFGKSLLMLAHAPFISPVDYRDLLQVHKTAAECIKGINAWLSTMGQDRSSEGSLRLAHRHFIEAQTLMQNVYKLFSEKYVRPAECNEAREQLLAIGKHIQELSILLSGVSSPPKVSVELPESLFVERYDIDQRVRDLTTRIKAFRSICLEATLQTERQQQEIQDHLRELRQALDQIGAQMSIRVTKPWIKEPKPFKYFWLRELSQEELDELVKKLLACRCIRDRGSRRAILEKLRDEIAYAIPRHDIDLVDVTNIVKTCLDYSGGIVELIRAVRSFERNSLPMQKVDNFLESVALT
jgi:hypothetical protein